MKPSAATLIDETRGRAKQRVFRRRRAPAHARRAPAASLGFEIVRPPSLCGEARRLVPPPAPVYIADNQTMEAEECPSTREEPGRSGRLLARSSRSSRPST